MDLLTDWLAPTIRHELSHALRWKEGGSDKEQLPGTALRYSDDGSNLRIQSSKNGVVQISKFLEYEEPIVATVTDKNTRMNARMSVAATREYREDQKRPFTKDKTGGLIQILDFEIVATHIGPKTDRLMLFVNRFISLGSDGSAIPDGPRPIGSEEKGCSELLKALNRMREQEKFNGSRGPSTRESSAAASSLQSQTALGTSNHESPDSQSILVTQVPVARRVRLKSENSARVYETANHKRSGPARSFAARVEIKQPSSAAAKTARCGLSDPTPGQVHYPEASVDSLHVSSEKTPAAQNAEMTNVVINGATKAASFNEKDLVNAQQRISTKHLYKSYSFTENHNVEGSVDTSGPIIALSEARHRPSKKRKLNNRISSREVRIPKDQEELLNRKDSWLPAEPGQKEPRANIPIELLKAFNEDADSRQRKSAPTQEDPPDRAATVLDDDSTGTQTTDSESDIASARWPPSPDRNQLPPDSSPPDMDQVRQTQALESTKSAGQTLGLNDVLPTAISASSNDEAGNGLVEAIDAITAAKGANQSISLLSSSLNESAQPTSKEPSQGQTEELIGTRQDSDPLLHDNAQPETISKEESRSKFSFPSPELIPSSHSLPDSDIEMTVPIPLLEPTEVPENPSPERNYPSTAPSSKHPFTQVKRTPYADGHSHGEPDRPFVNGWRLELAKDKETNGGVLQEGNTQIPCTTSTFMSNSEESGTTSRVTNKSLAVPDQASSQGSPAIDEHVSKDSSSIANAKSSAECDVPLLHEPLPRKRLLQSNENLMNGGVNSKRLKTDSNYPYADSSRPRDESAGRPAQGVSNVTRKPLTCENSAYQCNNEASAASNDDGKDAANGTRNLFNKSHGIEFDDSSKNASAAVSSPIIESDITNSRTLHANEMPTKNAIKGSGIGLSQDENHALVSRTNEPIGPSSPHQSLPLQTEAPANGEASISADKCSNEAHPLPSASKAGWTADPAHIASPNIKNGRSEIHTLATGQPKALSSPQAFLDHFRSIYPDYVGDIEHFLSLCTIIERRWKQGRLHKSMWDDFLIRNKIEYADHVRQCKRNREIPLPYEKFYDEEIDEPRYRKKVLTPLNLDMIIHSNILRDMPSHTTKIASPPVKQNLNALPDAAGQVANGLPAAVNSANAIDLTRDDVVNTATKRQENVKFSNSQPSGRRIPWLTDRNGQESFEAGSRHIPSDKQRRLLATEPTEHQSKKLRSPDEESRLEPTSAKSGKPKSQSVSANAQGNDTHETTPALWWQDENTPFKNFVRSYLAIRPGKGNAFAKPEDIARGKREHKRNMIRGLEDLDILNWKV